MNPPWCKFFRLQFVHKQTQSHDIPNQVSSPYIHHLRDELVQPQVIVDQFLSVLLVEDVIELVALPLA